MLDPDESVVDEQKTERQLIRRNFRLAASAAVLLLAGGSVFYHFVEHFSWINATYFCTITLTTIGYGDIVPTTVPGKLFTIFYVLVGIGILATFANTLVKNAVLRREERQIRRGKIGPK